MVVGRDARKRTAQRVRKGSLVFASHMEVVADVSILIVTKVLKEGLCSVRHMVEESVAPFWDAIKVRKEAPCSAKAMVEERDVYSKGGGVCLKSVHGGTLYCVAHGGGKRCVVPECTKIARGRADFCVRHGGGKRCKFENCGKSAQGSTDFCKAHGGGKRCSWGLPGSEFDQGDGHCNSLARGKTGLCASHSALLQDRRVHGGATLGTTAQDCTNNPPPEMKQLFTVEDMNVDNAVTSSSGWKFPDLPQVHFPVESNPSPSKASEGRVHGGNFMALFSGNQVSRGEAGPSQEPIGTAHQPWM